MKRLSLPRLHSSAQQFSKLPLVTFRSRGIGDERGRRDVVVGWERIDCPRLVGRSHWLQNVYALVC